jgi:hypothetical protein
VTRELVGLLHAGGVNEAIAVDHRDVARVIARLTSCHGHVFVVDQSRHAPGSGVVVFGVSVRGAACIRDELGET